MDTIREPLPRKPRPCLSNPALDDLLGLSLHRVQDAAGVFMGDAPPRVFPTVEHTRATFFTHAEWDTFGNLESERARLTYTLTKYPDRGIPRQCQGLLQELLAHDSILDAWPALAPKLRKTMLRAIEDLICATRAGLPPATATNSSPTKASFLALPVAFDTVPGALDLWRRAVEEISVDLLNGSTGRLQSFLEVHALVKDPSSDFEARISQRLALAKQLLDSLVSGTLPREKWEDVAAQIAAEASFLSVATCEPWRVNHILFSHHQQLCYFDVPLNKLERAEFSKPSRVVELCVEMLLSVKDDEKGQCNIVPIVAGPCPGTDNSTIIIDGNNRATAVMLLRLLASVATPAFDDAVFTSTAPTNGARTSCRVKDVLAEEPTRTKLVEEYCRKHNLGIKWQVDLLDALETASTSAGLLELLQGDGLKSFADVKAIPALLAQEENFHTVCLQRKDKLTLLLPVHQLLFNSRQLGLGLPQRAAQAHGMTLGTAVLPLR